MNTTTYANSKNPAWWSTENDSAWDRVKEAFKRDWDQTKHDFGGREPETNQNIGNTVRQASGKEAVPPRHTPTYEDVEAAYRYGHGARSYYRQQYPVWDDELEARLRDEWLLLDPARRSFWDADREAIRYGWEFDEM